MSQATRFYSQRMFSISSEIHKVGPKEWIPTTRPWWGEWEVLLPYIPIIVFTAIPVYPLVFSCNFPADHECHFARSRPGGLYTRWHPPHRQIWWQISPQSIPCRDYTGRIWCVPLAQQVQIHAKDRNLFLLKASLQLTTRSMPSSLPPSQGTQLRCARFFPIFVPKLSTIVQTLN